ncbi:MAG: FAD-linked oxidase C-terminal domain-containing protein, partial [Pseudomonadota bacterium]
MDANLKEKLIKIVGGKNFTDELIDLIAYSTDASEYRRRPDAAAWPTTAGQISEILKLANKEAFPVIARGAGTGLTGLAVPINGGLILDLSRMNKIIEINIEDRLVVVEPGVVYADLEKALSPHGFFFPPDPASGKVCTLGGNVAVNAGGIKGAKYGTTRDYVLGLRVVLPDGRIMRTGSRCMKNVSGYDMTRLFVGSEGTLGVITEIILKINPRPPVIATALAAFDDLEDAGSAVRDIMHSGIIPSALEIIDRETLMAVKGGMGLDLPDAAAILISETDGYTREETEYQLAKVMEIFRKNHATTVRRAENLEETEALWAARKASYGFLTRINPNLFAEDLAVPMSKIPEMLKSIEAISGRHDLRMPTVGHAGDGNIHTAFCIDGTKPDEVRRMHEATKELFQKVIELGGTLAAEHGIGLAKAPLMSLEHDEVSMGVMR